MTKTELLTTDPLKKKTAALIIGLLEEEKTLSPLLGAVDSALGGEIARMRKNGEIRGKAGETTLLPTYGRLPARFVLLAGLGRAEAVTSESLRRASGTAASVLRGRNLPEAVTTLALESRDPAADTEAVVEGTLLALYRFETYKSDRGEEAPYELKTLGVAVDRKNLKGAEGGRQWGEVISKNTLLARDLGNHPANVATPTMIARTAEEEARKRGITFLSYDREKLERMGLNALVGVAKGSDEPPRLIVLEYRPEKPVNDRPILLVGKTLTFDSGGISLKPADKMELMKGDMSGGAAVLGTILSVADLGLPVHVVAVMPATENMPSGRANKPGDVVRAYNGKTIEIINTDAEGRLILADALSFGIRTYHPRLVVDVATLTGAVVVALGGQALGILGNNEELIERTRKVGEETGERGWPLPLFEEYFEQIKSDVADIRNTGSKGGAGTITGAAFLHHFVDETPWVHLDIAGTAWVDSNEPYKPKGNVGMGVRLMTHLVKDLGEHPLSGSGKSQSKGARKARRA
jgi:leucyl aminopeptidase